MATTHAHYTYDAIRPDQLRMCRFVEDGDYLSAELKTFPAEGMHAQYKALSYVWALTDRGPEFNWAIHIGQRRLPALDSLAPFVSALRSSGALLDGTWWWIDSICIDQSNLEERSSHVRRMKEIYKDAQKVIAWLGEQTNDSATAPAFIDFLNELNDARVSHQELRKILHEEQYRNQWAAFREFFFRRWWSRIWTIQEFVIPGDITFWYGQRRLSREAVFAALTVADRCDAPEFKETLAFHHAFNRRRAWLLKESARESAKDHGLSLVALVAYFCNNEATDDRDRLYGLTGLAQIHHGLDIDYATSVDGVYLHFAKSFIAEHKSLDIVPFASLFPATHESSLPSWVPDWRARRQPLVMPLMISQGVNDCLGNLRPPRLRTGHANSTGYMASGKRESDVMFEGSTLLARGFVIDAVDDIADSQAPQSTVGANFDSSDSTPHSDIFKSVCRSIVLNRGDRYLQTRMPAEQFNSDFLHLCLLLISGSGHLVHKEFQDWFDTVRRLPIKGRLFEDILRSFQDQSSGSKIQSAPNQDEYVQDSFYGRFIDVVQRLELRLSTTCDNRIGMVPRTARTGDLICILFGCTVPLLLRKNEHQDKLTLVGECYLDGCMEGEVLEACDLKETEFQII